MTVLSLEMVTIPEGFFLMGADEEKEIDSEYEEQPEKQVWLSTYQIQQTPVTVGHWHEFLRQTDYSWNLHHEVAQNSPTFEHPITHISWYDACKFTEWLRETLGSNYALPTEAQWEKACRGQHGQLYPWGDQEPEWADEIPLYVESNLPIGSRPDWQSPYGCLDMWQGVREWCLDWFDYGDYFHDASVEWLDPDGIETGELKVIRGGSPLTSGWPRCTYRCGVDPNSRHNTLGFRIVLNPSVS